MTRCLPARHPGSPMNKPLGHLSRKSLTPKSPVNVLVTVLLACAGVSASVAAQNAPAPAPAASVRIADQGADDKPAMKPLIKPGDRTCLQSTGRLIPAKKGDCLPVPGRSYSGEELRNNGAIDNAHSLQMLDPSITRGH